MDKKKNWVLAAIACLSFYFMGGTAGIISPALQSLAEEYPNVPFTTILLAGSIPSLLSVPASLLCGAMAGRKISFRTLGIWACILIGIGGAAPYVLRSSWTVILISRGVFGFGFGIVMATMAVLITRLFEGTRQAKLLGYGTAAMAVSGVVLPLISGMLVVKNVHLMWLLHLIGLVAFLIVALWLPEPEKVAATGTDKSTEKVHIPFYAWIIIIGFSIACMAMYSGFLGSSTVVAEENLGTAAAAGLIISMYFAGNFIGGLTFAQFTKLTGRLNLGLSLLIGGIGMVFMAFGGSIILLYIGFLLVGIGYGGLWFPAMYTVLGQIVSPGSMAMAGALVAGISSLAGFITPYWMSFSANLLGNPSPRSAFLTGTVVYAILTIIFLLYKPATKANSAPAIPEVVTP